jgi:hexokinase
MLVACALHAILDHSGWTSLECPKRIVITFDGGVYDQFKLYRSMLRQSLDHQLGRWSLLFLAHTFRFDLSSAGKYKASFIHLTLTREGSCLGAAVLAAAAAAAAAAPVVVAAAPDPASDSIEGST